MWGFPQTKLSLAKISRGMFMETVFIIIDKIYLIQDHE